MKRENLRIIGSHEEKAVPTGKYTVTRYGNKKPVTKLETWVKTPCGSMRLSVWKTLYREALEEEGQLDLLEKVIDQVKRLPFVDDPELYAMECIDCGAYLSWDATQ